MGGQDRILASVTVLLLGTLWLGFLFHRSPSFAGSPLGGAFAVLGAAFLLVPLAYTAVKRSTRLRRWWVDRRGFQSLLQAHIYFGLLGSLLAIVHSGHKFDSVLGVVLTASMLASVLTGYMGHYFQRYVADDLREKKASLDKVWRAMEGRLVSEAQGSGLATSGGLLPLASAAADLQYAVEFQAPVRRLSKAWLWAHITSSVIFYLALALHVWAGIYFGLRWFR